MADIKYEIVEELGVISENAKDGEKNLTISVGMVQLQNMILEIGHQTTKRWEKELHLVQKKHRNCIRF